MEVVQSYKVFQVFSEYGGKPVLMFAIDRQRFQVPPGLTCQPGDYIAVLRSDATASQE